MSLHNLLRDISTAAGIRRKSAEIVTKSQPTDYIYNSPSL